jgi:hypothetical protein
MRCCSTGVKNGTLLFAFWTPDCSHGMGSMSSFLPEWFLQWNYRRLLKQTEARFVKDEKRQYQQNVAYEVKRNLYMRRNNDIVEDCFKHKREPTPDERQEVGLNAVRIRVEQSNIDAGTRYIQNLIMLRGKLTQDNMAGVQKGTLASMTKQLEGLSSPQAAAADTKQAMRTQQAVEKLQLRIDEHKDNVEHMHMVDEADEDEEKASLRAESAQANDAFSQLMQQRQAQAMPVAPMRPVPMLAIAALTSPNSAGVKSPVGKTKHGYNALV